MECALTGWHGGSWRSEVGLGINASLWSSTDESGEAPTDKRAIELLLAAMDDTSMLLSMTGTSMLPAAQFEKCRGAVDEIVERMGVFSVAMDARSGGDL